MEQALNKISSSNELSYLSSERVWGEVSRSLEYDFQEFLQIIQTYKLDKPWFAELSKIPDINSEICEIKWCEVSQANKFEFAKHLNIPKNYLKQLSLWEKFYEYDEKGRRLKLWEGLRSLNIEKKSADISTETVKNRLAYVQALEAARALEENILLSVEEGDVGGILGCGCLIWAGGPFSWLDHVGHENVLSECQKLFEQYGARFAPPKIIKELASSGSKFYN